MGHYVRLLPTTLHSKVGACCPSITKPSPGCKSDKQIHLFSSHPAVEVRLHEPLWKVQFSPDDVAIEVVALCSQLEPLLCMKEYAVRNISIAFMNCLVYFALLLFVLVDQVTKNTQR